MTDDAPTYFRNDHALSMLMRDYFAAQAMQGISTNLATLREPNWLAMAEDAYRMADAMMEARKQK